MHSTLLALLLQGAFFLVLILEFLVPSAGILTVLSLFCLGGSWYFVLQSTASGLFGSLLIADIVLIPIALFVGFRLLQRSPIANRQGLDSGAGFQSQHDLTPELVGKEGVTTSMLKPWGKVEVAGQVLDAVSLGEYIEPGTPVRVLDVAQNRLKVEPLSFQGDKA
ncbi:MAG TPA: NfeD family protein [Fibrobacteraceae bacterium]|nr:NfeD family protein [Fibrobacteraceae bacterium]